MLNELDRELEKRGHKYVRYADDCMILCKSQKGAKRTKESITRYIEGKLFLKVNREKTNVLCCTQVKYLGFGFYNCKGETRIRVHPQSIKKMKDTIRYMTKRNGGISHEMRAKKINPYIRGWVNYYALSDMKSLAREIDGWLRRRIRCIQWKQWKTRDKRAKELIKAGIRRKTAQKVAGSEKGLWRVAKSPTINRALGNERIRKLGYLTFSEQFLKVCEA